MTIHLIEFSSKKDSTKDEAKANGPEGPFCAPDLASQEWLPPPSLSLLLFSPLLTPLILVLPPTTIPRNREWIEQKYKITNVLASNTDVSISFQITL